MISYLVVFGVAAVMSGTGRSGRNTTRTGETWPRYRTSRTVSPVCSRVTSPVGSILATPVEVNSNAARPVTSRREPSVKWAVAVTRNFAGSPGL